MKQHFFALALVPILVALVWLVPASQPASASASPTAVAPAQGGWTTGSTGALGDFTAPTGNHVIDLATDGIYDPVQWCVYLDYKRFTVPAGSTVWFLNHPKRAPVVIRCEGDVVINGVVDVSGGSGHLAGAARVFAEPGPGGFFGGRGGTLPEGNPTSSAGHGPGGGFTWSGGGAYERSGGSGSHTSQGNPGWSGAGPIYDVPAATPLVGGSGGGGGYRSDGPAGGGGAGGGAILIGSDVEVRVAGQIRANGGWYGSWGQYNSGGAGSGGTIRIAAPSVYIAPSASLRAQSDGNYGLGRIRVDALTNPGAYNAIPAGVYYPLGEFLPEPTLSPRLTLHSWRETQDGPKHPIGQDPQARILPATAADVPLPTIGQKIVRIEGRRIPVQPPAMLEVRVTYTEGQAVVIPVPMGNAGGDFDLSFSDVQIDFASGVSTVQVLARL